MLTAVLTGAESRVLARDVLRTDGPFSCPGCGQEVIAKKGEKKVHHFAHKTAVECAWGRGESEEHRQCKQAIFDALTGVSHVENLELEKDFGAVVADVYAEIRGAKVAIEVQRSNLSDIAIAERTRAYDRLGIFVLWLALNPPSHGERFNPAAWQKWLHAAYFGRVFYWVEGAQIVQVHFDAYTEQRGGQVYFQKGGIERESTVFNKFFKQARTTNRGPVLDLASSFYPTAQPGLQMGGITVPRCRLFSSKTPRWWT
ncbi:competence protein CoiA [Noviherbaspirillum galbum]|uniref:Competence protein CoiA n=1 Tax=Noviherbaspirillum galbum TaxID=2709383 RepID=A0A6B3SRR8_9BURK|nr:competence protein CoiA family protein [Noviherbaspirillum galbum]NEX63443.1 competence protein CoiA [Noviherbaspirillum galbum]